MHQRRPRWRDKRYFTSTPVMLFSYYADVSIALRDATPALAVYLRRGLPFFRYFCMPPRGGERYRRCQTRGFQILFKTDFPMSADA